MVILLHFYYILENNPYLLVGSQFLFLPCVPSTADLPQLQPFFATIFMKFKTCFVYVILMFVVIKLQLDQTKIVETAINNRRF